MSDDRFIPNSYQLPNLYTDRVMAHLSGEEWKVLCYMARRIFGFHRRADRISQSQLTDGLRDDSGHAIDYGTGLSRSAVRSAVASLIAFGLVEETAPYNKAQNLPPEYRLQLDPDGVNWAGLLQRQEDRKAKGRKRTRKARQAAEEGQAAGGLSVGQTRGLVCPTDKGACLSDKLGPCLSDRQTKDQCDGDENNQENGSNQSTAAPDKFRRARALYEQTFSLFLTDIEAGKLRDLCAAHNMDVIDRAFERVRTNRPPKITAPAAYVAAVAKSIEEGAPIFDRSSAQADHESDRAGYAVNRPAAGQEETAPPPAVAPAAGQEETAPDPWAVVRAELRELVPVSHSRAIDLARFTNGNEYTIHIPAGDGRDQALVDYLGRYARQAKAAIVSLGRPALPVRFVLDDGQEEGQGVARA